MKNSDIIDKLKERANKYEKDVKAGILGFGCWGRRTIVKELRKIANEFKEVE